MGVSRAIDGGRLWSPTSPGTEQPWGAPSVRRNNAIAKLLPSMKALTEQLNDVLLAGGLTEDDYAHLSSLQMWVGRLIAEQAAAGKAPRTRGK